MMNHDNNSLIWKPPETILIRTGTLQEGTLKSRNITEFYFTVCGDSIKLPIV